MNNLQEQIDNILRTGIELGTDDGQPYIKYTEAAVDDLVALIKSTVLEIIGEDDIVEFGDPLLAPTFASQDAKSRDKLRQSQREHLNKILGE